MKGELRGPGADDRGRNHNACGIGEAWADNSALRRDRESRAGGRCSKGTLG